MGNTQTAEEYLEEEKKSPRLNRDTVRFPGFKEKDRTFLEHEQATQQAFDQITDLVSRLASFVGLPGAVGTILKITTSKMYGSSVEEALLELKIEKIAVNTVHPLLKAEMDSITRQMNLINDPQSSANKKTTQLAIADDTCYKLLVKFSDDGFYLKKYPFAFAPFLMSFVAVYVPIATANYRLHKTPTRQREYARNMRQLQDTLVYFKEKAIKERLGYIVDNHPGEGVSFISDGFLEKNTVVHIAFERAPYIMREVSKWYRGKVEKKYVQYFQSALHVFEKLDLEN